MALDVPLGKELKFAAQFLLVVFGQLARPARALPAHERRGGVVKERGCAVFVKCRDVGNGAQVGDEKETLGQVMREHFGRIELSLTQQRGYPHEGARILSLGRRIHGNQGARIEKDAKIAQKAGVGGGALEPKRGTGERYAQPRVERAKTIIHGAKRDGFCVYPSPFILASTPEAAVRSRPILTVTIALVGAIVPAFCGAQEAEGLRLRLERQLRVAPSRPERNIAKFLEADRIEGDQDHAIVASGSVTLRQRGALIRADRLEYLVPDKTGIGSGSGRVEAAR